VARACVDTGRHQLEAAPGMWDMKWGYGRRRLVAGSAETLAKRKARVMWWLGVLLKTCPMVTERAR